MVPETYHPATYLQHYLRGQKQISIGARPRRIAWGRAGIDKIHLGALIGLSYSWRTDQAFRWRNTCLYLQQTLLAEPLLDLVPARSRLLRRRH